ncbi:BLIP family protein [Streptomyces sp. URMC 126]|uniref:BLIP family protein n=1 Tax=Streptomyces sp. URMC 126 TaxID=3423401 RepID=UPI003F1CACEB
MSVFRRTAATWAAAGIAAGAAVLGTAAGAQAGVRSDAPAEEKFSFTAAKYEAVRFGADKADVSRMLGVGKTSPGSSEGWCDDSGVTITCRTTSGDYPPYAHFSFNAAGKLYLKDQNMLIKPKTPNLKRSQYDRVRNGMTEAQLWASVPKDACVLSQESFPNWPSADGREVIYECQAGTGLFPPSGWFYLTDGKVTYKHQRGLA